MNRAESERERLASRGDNLTVHSLNRWGVNAMLAGDLRPLDNSPTLDKRARRKAVVEGEKVARVLAHALSALNRTRDDVDPDLLDAEREFLEGKGIQIVRDHESKTFVPRQLVIVR